MPSQQSSLIGMRTALMCHVVIAFTEAASLGPSKTPQPWMQAYSLPERLTPCQRTTRPLESRRRLPETWRPGRVRLLAPGAEPANEQSRSTPRATVSIRAAAIAAGRVSAVPAAFPLGPDPGFGPEPEQAGHRAELLQHEHRRAGERPVGRGGSPRGAEARQDVDRDRPERDPPRRDRPRGQVADPDSDRGEPRPRDGQGREQPERRHGEIEPDLQELRVPAAEGAGQHASELRARDVQLAALPAE